MAVNTTTSNGYYHSQNFALAALCMVASGAGFAALGGIVRLVSSELDTAEIVFLRNATALVFLLPWLIISGTKAWRTQRLRQHCLRAAFGLSAMYCFFFALARLTLAEAVLLNYTAPLFMPIFARLWLNEPLSKSTLTAVAIGFVGVLLILKPGANLFQLASLVGLAAGALAALAMMTIRRLSSTEPAARTVLYFTVFSTAISAGPVTLDWQLSMNSTVLIMAGGGLIAIASQFLITRAYSLAPAARVSPFTYSTVVFAAIIGWLGWRESLDGLFICGALLVIVAGAVTSWQRQSG